MSDSKEYTPTSAEIEGLAKPAIDPAPTVPVEIEGYKPTLAANQSIAVTSEETKQKALESIQETMDDLKHFLKDIKSLAPASQSSYFYQVAALIAKTRVDAARVLFELSNGGAPAKDKRGGPTSQHIHLNMTSAQMADVVAKQIKAKKENGDQ